MLLSVTAPHAVVLAAGGVRLRLRSADQGTGTGTRVWRSALLAIEACAEGWGGVSVRGRRVLELGCGTAAAGLACASLGAAEVWLTDIDADALALARTNARRLARTTQGAEARVCALDLNSPGESEAAAAAAGGFDLVLASDLLYDWADPRAVAAALARFLAAAPHARALCVHDRHRGRSAAALACVDAFGAEVESAGALRRVASEARDADGGELLLECYALRATVGDDID